MKKLLTTLALSSTSILSFNSFANEQAFLELGLGVEYGGLGTQIFLPSPIDNIDAFLAVGLFSYSSRTDEEYGFGAGLNYYLGNNHSINLYYGVLHEESYLNDQFEVKRDQDYGISLGYKYYFSGRKKPGFTAGATFNAYDGDTYPMFSLGYRF